MIEAVFFYLLTGLMLVAAISVAVNRNPIYSVLSLLVVMFALAGLFIMLGAYFLAALQILLYAGAVLVLFLFVVMLLNLKAEARASFRIFTFRGISLVLGIILFALIGKIIKQSPLLSTLPEVDINGSVESIGRLLFTTYLLPFELTSFIILAAIIGAVTLSRQDSSKKKGS